ncbi:MAG: DNA-binding protein [uncultured Sulfurovum sp.]|uniref:DNA-binding protein n=1 Tax=uncultured Sulfurovum sp. TaxID=269237 RepID=A0A6S6S9T5_9BACT|nr:MAG: DNA-binding protein [uncultured Sulfurovum sp.]
MEYTMKTITLKTDDTFFNKVTNLSKHLHMSKSELIRKSVIEYENYIKKQALKEQIKESSMRVRVSNKAIIKDFDETNSDGLTDV